LLNDFIPKKVYTACLQTSHKIVPPTSLHKYLYNGEREMKVNINNSSGGGELLLQMRVMLVM